MIDDFRHYATRPQLRTIGSTPIVGFAFGWKDGWWTDQTNVPVGLTLEDGRVVDAAGRVIWKDDDVEGAAV